MDRRKKGRASSSRKQSSQRGTAAPLNFSDEEDSEESEEESILATNRGGGRRAGSRSSSRHSSVSSGGRHRGGRHSQHYDYDDDDDAGSSEEDHDEEEVVRSRRQLNGGRGLRGGGGRGRKQRQQEEEEDSEQDSEEEDSEEDEDDHHQHRGRSLGGIHDPLSSRYAGGGSYLPTAYGGNTPGGPEAALGQPKRERSVDRIRARSRDRRRDISRERGNRRDRSRSVSQSRKTENQKANDRAAERRRNRRISLEQSLGMMGMDDSASLAGMESVNSTATDITQGSLSLINGIDTSFSKLDESTNRKSYRGTERDSTSTDYTADRKRRTNAGGKQVKNWDGRLDNVLNRRRGQKTNDVGTSRSVSPTANPGKEKRSGRRLAAAKSS